MNKEIKENLTGLMITLGTDTERKFAWCLRKINNRPFICIHKRKDGYSKFNDNDLYNLTICKIEEDDYYDIEKWLCLDKELSYCLNIAKENYKTYKNK